MPSRVGTRSTAVPRATSVIQPVQVTNVLVKRRDERHIEKAVVCKVSWVGTEKKWAAMGTAYFKALGVFPAELLAYHISKIHAANWPW